VQTAPPGAGAHTKPEQQSAVVLQCAGFVQGMQTPIPFSAPEHE